MSVYDIPLLTRLHIMKGMRSDKIMPTTHVHSGVPHSSVLGPILFIMYIKPLSAIIYSHSIVHHSFSDDLQLQMSAPQIEYLSYFTLCSHV